MGPLVILNVLATAMLAGHILFKIILALYMLFFLAAAAGRLADRQGLNAKVLTVPYYFILVNLSATMGIIDFFRKKQAITWKTVRN